MNNNPFAQTTNTYKISTKCFYQDLEIIEEKYIQNNIKDLLSVSTFEISGISIDAMPEDIWGLDIYLNQKPDIKQINFSFTNFCKENKINLFKEFSSDLVQDCDWVSLYAKQLSPIETDKFFITSSLCQTSCVNNKLPIYIEASRAFGTGQHETTKGCIMAIEHLSQNHNFNQILDIGTGTGILAICAKKIWPEADIFACDIEDTAVEIAINNAHLNKTNIFVFKNKEHQILNTNNITKKFNLIVSNILARPLIELAPAISNHAFPNSYLILSGFLTNQLSEVLESFKEFGWQYEHCFNNNSWSILILKN